MEAGYQVKYRAASIKLEGCGDRCTVEACALSAEDWEKRFCQLSCPLQVLILVWGLVGHNRQQVLDV